MILLILLISGGSIDVFITYGMVLVLWGVGPILGNGYEIMLH